MISSPLVRESVAIVEINSRTDSLFHTLFREGNDGGSTHCRTGEEGIAIEQDGSRFISGRLGAAADAFKTVTCTNHKDIAETILQADREHVSRVGVCRERTSECESMLSIITGKTLFRQFILREIGIFTTEEQEVVGNTNCQQRGHLKLGRTHFQSLLVLLAGNAGANGKTVTGIMHRQTDVLQRDTNLEVLKLTRHILDTGIDGKTRSLGVGNTLVDNLNGDTTLDEVVEGLRVVQADIGQRGAESTQTAFGLIGSGDLDIAETLAEERQGDHTEVSLFAQMLSDGDRIHVDATAGTHQVLRPVESQLRLTDRGKTGDIGEDGFQTADFRHAGARHSACVSPGINQQVGCTRLTGTVSVTCKHRGGACRYESDNCANY